MIASYSFLVTSIATCSRLTWVENRHPNTTDAIVQDVLTQFILDSGKATLSPTSIILSDGMTGRFSVICLLILN